jgi:hypothetical protein
MLAKKFKKYVFQRNLGLSLKKYIVLQGKCPFLQETSTLPQ